MRKTFRVCLLVLALACPTLAGEIHNPRQPPPPNSPQEQAAEGEIPTPKTTEETTTEIVLILLRSVLPLF